MHPETAQSVRHRGRQAVAGIRICIPLLTLIAVASLAAQTVLVDQIGYRPNGSKIVRSTTAADSFEVIDNSSGSPCFAGALIPGVANDPATGLTLWSGDFSGVTAPGTYTIRLRTGALSPAFRIADTVFRPLARAALKAFYLQRCGMTLSMANAGFFMHQACHLSDAAFHPTAESSGVVIATGGWHDAGDFGKYVVNAGVTVGTLLLAYEMFPQFFAGDDVGIPESGNGVPDLLDETRYELAWILRMQSSGGGFFTKLTHLQFEGFVMPDADTGTRYIYQISSTATGDAVAMLARAARIYRAFDTTFAATCLSAARKGWTYLQAHPSIVPDGGFRNPTDTGTGEYGDGDDRDERLWAASELYATTGENAYRDYYYLHFSDRGLFEAAPSWPNVTALAHATYLTAPIGGQDPAIAQSLRNSLQAFCQEQVARHAASGLGVTLVPGEFVWGSNSCALNNAVILILGGEVFGTSAYRRVAADQLHYVLGVNLFGGSYVTGTGTRNPRYPHHRPSACDRVADPVPGLLVGGPNQYLNDPVLAAKFTPQTPPAACYADDQGSYASNEVAINWNAPLVFVAGYLAATSQSLSVGDDGGRLPEAPALDQNYPNPFNPATHIRFRMRESGPVRVEVMDLLGRTVATLVDGYRRPGEYDVVFDARTVGASSGVYFYRLTTGEMSESRRLVLVR